MAFPVAEVDHVVVDEHAVGGEGEAEILVVLLFDAPGVGHQVLHHLEVHQGLAAEEVHLQVPPGAGIFDEEVQGPLAHLKGHHRPLAVVLTLAGEAVGAVEVAGVGNVQAQSLHHTGSLFLQLIRHGLVGVGDEELFSFLQRNHLLVAFGDIGFGDIGAVGEFFSHGGKDRFLVVIFKHGDDFVSYLVHGVDGAGANVQHDIVAAQFILMYHRISSIKNAAIAGGVFLTFRSRKPGWRCRSWSCRRTGR